MAGYSGTPLVQKLGIRPEYRIAFVRPPDNFGTILGELPPGCEIRDLAAEPPFEVIVAFVGSTAELVAGLDAWIAALAQAGGLWIAWPKKSSGVKTDLHEQLLRDVILAVGLVDNKVCAIDETWSGLRFVRRLENRR